jgi:GT2 family glycosyltransferase
MLTRAAIEADEARMFVGDAEVAVVIVGYRNADDVGRCLRALENLHGSPRFSVFICENGGGDAFEALVRVLAEISPVREDAGDVVAASAGAFLRAARLQLGESGRQVTVAEARENLGFSGGHNAWLRVLGPIDGLSGVWILNPDTAPEPAALSALFDYAKKNSKGMVGSRMMEMSHPGRLAMRGLRWRRLVAKALWVDAGAPTAPAPKAAEVESRIDVPSGASFFVTRSCLERIGLMDERYFLYFEDIDWGLRARSCCGVGYADDSVVHHAGGTTMGSAGGHATRSKLAVYLEFRNRLLFVRSRFPAWYFWTIAVSILRSGQLLGAGAYGNFVTALRGIIAGLRGEEGRPDVFLSEMEAEAARVFVRAVQEALSTVATSASASVDAPEFLAVDLDEARRFFDALWPAGGTEEQKASTRSQRFNAGLKTALAKNLVATLDIEGRRLVRLTQAKPERGARPERATRAS